MNYYYNNNIFIQQQQKSFFDNQIIKLNNIRTQPFFSSTISKQN